MLLRKRKQLFNNQFILLTISKFTLMKKLFVCALALAAFVACDKEPNVSGGDEAGKVYMSFSVKMETTRTGTDEDGDTNSDATPDYEVGKDRENKISKVDIVLANAEGAYVVADNVVPAAAAKDTYVASFNTTALTPQKTYQVYVYANCDAPQALALDATSTATVTEMTVANNFWMTNAYAAVDVTLPADLSPYTQPQNPLNLQSHYVERAMARFDYMPKGPYPLSDAEGNEVAVTLTDAALINQSKAFYMFRRVSADGTNANWAVGGVETPQNYVVDVDYAEKAGGYTAGQIVNFDYHLTDSENWNWKSITAAALTEKDSWEGEDDGKTDYDGDHSLNDYYIWQYAKENTIPQVPGVTEEPQAYANQEHGITTGVVFKGELTGAAVTAAAGEPIYVFKNKLYGTWDDVKTAATTGTDAELAAAYNTVVAAGENATVKTYADAGFTGYSAEDGKYYAYYYYWNRHNDNENNEVMGKMEFAVVRNNVYKLCVDKISKFGHPDPTVPENPDPDPVDPTDPDEEKNYYFNVTVKVLPWVVRVNHIEF